MLGSQSILILNKICWINLKIDYYRQYNFQYFGNRLYSQFKWAHNSVGTEWDFLGRIPEEERVCAVWVITMEDNVITMGFVMTNSDTNWTGDINWLPPSSPCKVGLGTVEWKHMARSCHTVSLVCHGDRDEPECLKDNDALECQKYDNENVIEIMTH